MTNQSTKTTLDTIRTIVRIVVGVLFCVSAVAKAVEFDHLELYIFSFGVFPLTLSFWIARLLVAIELILGIALISNIRRRAVAWSALGVVLGFSAFLGYALTIGRTDNCHCMGEFIEMSPQQSLIKNLILGGALCFILPQRRGLKLQGWKIGLASLAITGGVFIISPPDNINPHLSYESVLNREAFDAVSSHQGKRIVCLYSTVCPYCELASSKIASIARRHNLEANVEVWFASTGADIESQIAAFYERTLSPTFRYNTLPFKEFLTITHGEMPIILLVDGNSILREYNYRSIDEQEIRTFFN